MYAKNLDRMVSFYTKTFGLIVVEAQRGDYAVLTGPEVELSIVGVCCLFH
jgi:catechol 2,3-dioxygenase-like lactoylglutathione lyase family enzyme